MKRALALARRGEGRASPNPMVGAVLVRDDVIVSTGWHRGVSKPHAEAEAIEKAGPLARGSTLYLNLEPCNHFGRTPPCTSTIINSGVARVVAAMSDPDPRVRGSGFDELGRAGIEVESGLLSAEAERLNEAYIVHRTLGRPFVTYKAAITLDGRTAAADGSSQWITSEESRKEVQRMRARSDAICVGIGTVLADDPSLTVRVGSSKRKPLRVVVDSMLRVPSNARVLSGEAPTAVIATGPSPNVDLKHAEVINVDGKNGEVLIPSMLEELAKRDVVSLLLEGGGKLAGSFAVHRLIDKYVFFVAPKLLGSKGTHGVLESWGAPSLSAAEPLRIESVKRFGDDLRVVAYPVRGES